MYLKRVFLGVLFLAFSLGLFQSHGDLSIFLKLFEKDKGTLQGRIAENPPDEIPESLEESFILSPIHYNLIMIFTLLVGGFLTLSGIRYSIMKYSEEREALKPHVVLTKKGENTSEFLRYFCHLSREELRVIEFLRERREASLQDVRGRFRSEIIVSLERKGFITLKKPHRTIGSTFLEKR
ncbi:MAG: hypothetical protein ACE5K0_08045 [Candidatus Methanofastidiosia archaeon]